jgi:hypothetical protein
MEMTDTNTQKETALDFLRLTARGEVDDAFARYAAPDFRHHNPHFAADAATLRAAMKENAGRFPHMVFEVQRAFACGDGRGRTGTGDRPHPAVRGRTDRGDVGHRPGGARPDGEPGRDVLVQMAQPPA